MCFVSAVMQQYQPYIPDQWQRWEEFYSPKEIKELRELIDSFKDAVEAAKTFDRLTGQEDCVDPEKAKLEKRVEQLERRMKEYEER